MNPLVSISDGSGGLLYDMNLLKAEFNEQETKLSLFPLFHFNADYDDKGNQTWGSKYGPFVFNKEYK